MAGPPCGVGLVIDKMSEEERAKFNQALASPEVRKSDIARALRAAGHRVSGWSLRHHSRMECKCLI